MSTLARIVTLRAMTADDLPFVASWLREPHVARWWLPDTTPEAELEQLSERVSATGDQATQMLTILERGRHARDGGWCQWYPCAAYPAEAEALAPQAGDCGIDYAIGDRAAVGRGLGTQLIAALVDEVRRHHPGCGVIADPDAKNAASRRVLERNGFSLIAVRAIASERNDHAMAIYRHHRHDILRLRGSSTAHRLAIDKRPSRQTPWRIPGTAVQAVGVRRWVSSIGRRGRPSRANGQLAPPAPLDPRQAGRSPDPQRAKDLRVKPFPSPAIERIGAVLPRRQSEETRW